MKNNFMGTVLLEFSKILSSRIWLIVFGLAAIVQPLLALVEANSLLEIGLDATPETHPCLAVALPPLDYFGFDVVLFGLMAMVIWGGIAGASEFKNHNLRTTLLCVNNRKEVFLAKLMAVFISCVVISFVSIYLTIAATHIALGEQGLNPLTLSAIAWRYIGYAILDWVLLTTLSFGLGILSRSAIVPLVFLIPQVYNLGNFLAAKWEWGKYLPVAAGNVLISSPTDPLLQDPLQGGLTLAIWTAVIVVIAALSFQRRDVGGAY